MRDGQRILHHDTPASPFDSGSDSSILLRWYEWARYRGEDREGCRDHENHSRDCVQALIDAVTKSLKKGDRVSFVGFGTFKTANRKARTALNPQTGAAILIPKRRVPRFSPGKALKQAVR
jgi:nucleoid DNA-binding protein